MVTWGERFPGFALAVLIVVLGLNPNWLSRWTELTTIGLVKDFPIVVHQQALREPAIVAQAVILDLQNP